MPNYWPASNSGGTVTAVTGTLPITSTGGTTPDIAVNAFTGDAGAGGLKGAVPAPAAGDATKFLRGDATWQSPGGGGGGGAIIISDLSFQSTGALETFWGVSANFGGSISIGFDKDNTIPIPRNGTLAALSCVIGDDLDGSTSMHFKLYINGVDSGFGTLTIPPSSPKGIYNLTGTPVAVSLGDYLSFGVRTIGGGAGYVMFMSASLL